MAVRATTEVGFELTGRRERLRPFLREAWAARGLMHTLAKKDFYVRYRRASIGLLWAIGLPLVQSFLMALIFQRFVRFHQPGIPYSVLVLSGMIPWSFFSSSIVSATTSIVDGAGLASKVYFPRITLPIETIWSGFHGYIPSVAVLLGLAAVFRAHMSWHIVYVIPATILMLLLAAGFSFVLAAMHVYFRDTRYIVSAAILPWFFVSGVVYPVSTLGRLAGIVQYNPVVGMLQMYRAAFGAGHAWGKPVIITVAWIAVLLLITVPVYQRHNRNFVDRL
jgi:lipopolysaccharide transport system permease protein